MARFQEALRSLRSLSLLGSLARSGGDLNSIADLVDNFRGSEPMAQCLERFRALPGAEALLREAPPVPRLDLAQLSQLPHGSLGHSVARVLQTLGYNPSFARDRPIDSEETWLIQRIGATHDIHHVISGFDTTQLGENGVLAITAQQIGFPPFVVLTIASQFASFRLQPERYPLVSEAIARGGAIALGCAPLVTQRWEEGWERPLSAWRQSLGITPVAQEAYSLRRQLSDLDAEL